MELLYLVVLGVAVWIAFDVQTHGRVADDGMAAMGPWGWFFSVLLLAIIAVPLYLAKRGQRDRPQRAAPGHTRLDTSIPPPSPTAPVTPVAPPPGWYEDPEGGSMVRWWDGTGWTEHRQARSD